MAKKRPTVNFAIPATSGTTSSVKNVSNTGEMSTSTQSSGSTGAAVNNTNTYIVQGAAGAPGQSVTSISPPGENVGYTAGPYNWMDDAITRTIKNWPRG